MLISLTEIKDLLENTQKNELSIYASLITHPISDPLKFTQGWQVQI